MNKKYITSLANIFTPSLDPSTGGKFNMNHQGYCVIFYRQGDLLTVNHHGCQGLGPVRPLLKTETHRIAAVCSGLIAFCQEEGMDWECTEDIPEGFSYADPAKLADLRK